MGDIESKLKKKILVGKLQKGILATIAGLGVISVAAVAPGIFGAIGLARKTGMIRARMNFGVKRSVQRLVEKDYLVYEKTPKGTFLRITNKGKEYMSSNLSILHKNQKRKKWDKKWRIIIFDIQEKKKKLRDKVRLSLLEIGFVRLQDSVWVYPYDSEDLINLLKADFKIGKDILYIVADYIENDKYLKEHFELYHQ